MAKRIGVPKRIRDAAAARGCEVLRVGAGCALVDGYSRTVLTHGSIAGIARLLADDANPLWGGDPSGVLEPREWIPLNDLVVDD